MNLYLQSTDFRKQRLPKAMSLIEVRVASVQSRVLVVLGFLECREVDRVVNGVGTRSTNPSYWWCLENRLFEVSVIACKAEAPEDSNLLRVPSS